ncbi:uncharacterized protein LOC131000558 isoform X1 [Salvia miltiorrhiza]|uniref:uncharacterized protein LOC131000558 isoform X1 n=1 Tax=Salvia miltiorrhiza TaxID=226208 RepID=UPI0025ABEFA5|nr:uncharacterized protein LOC131000558 isoform X1 [Salvia miltiorrhiza]XP_057782529.1 uncharacterized protein LOC131000558 isoform X1 [Salvia miltiorrhiza]
MSMVGNSLDPDEEYDALFNILDFPIECLEGNEVAADWDSSNAQFLGPIPSSVLMEQPMMSNEEFNVPNLFPRPVAPIAAASKLKQLHEHVDTSGLCIPRQRKFAKVQESGSFHTQSPVSVLESSSSCLREKSLSIKSEHAVPARSRSKRVRYSGINPWLLAAHELSTSKRTSNAGRSTENRKRLFLQPVSIDLMRKSPENVENSLTVPDPAHQVKKCAHCQSTKTPLWREGPLGPKTLCNACGVQYRSGRLFPEYRPAASPTFVPSQHSNSHRKVAEMRSGTKQLKVKIEIVGAPDQKQLTKHVKRMQLAKHVDTSSSLQSAGAAKQRQLAELVDTSSSLQIAGAPKQKLLAKYDDTYSSQIPLQNKLAKIQESGASCTQSHVSLLQSSSYVRYRSKYVEPAGVNLGFLPSPCKKASSSMRGKENRKKLFKVPVAFGVMINSPEKDGVSLDVSDPAPLQNASNSMKGKQSRKRLLQLPVAVDVMKSSPKKEDASLDVSDLARLRNASNPSCPAVVKKCSHCQSSKTPQWREGPLGPQTLCNACGLRYRSGRLLPEYRPAASPTFMPSHHSNSHKKLVQMRIKAMKLTADI